MENSLVKERVSYLNRGVHRNAITFGLKEVTSQSNAGRNPDSPVQRVPAFCAIQWHTQITPWIGFFQNLPHWCTVKAKLGKPKHPVGIDPGIWAPNPLLDCVSKLGRIVWHFKQAEKGTAHLIAKGQPRENVQESNRFGGLVPRITDQPLVSAFSRHDNFLTGDMNKMCQLKQGGTGGIDYRTLRGLDQPGISGEYITGAELLHYRRLRSQVSGHQVCGTQFVELWRVDTNRIGIDRRTLQMASKSCDHARVNAA